MPIESATYISDLVNTNPVGTDDRSTADDHMRLIKAVLKTTFPNASAAITPSVAEFNRLDGLTSSTNELNILDGALLDVTELNYVNGVTSAIQTQLNLLKVKGADIASTGNTVLLQDGNYNDITGTGTINGFTDGILNERRTFHFDGVALLKHNTGAGGGFSSLFLSNGLDYTTVVNDEITFTYDGALWRMSGSNFYNAVKIAEGASGAPRISGLGLIQKRTRVRTFGSGTTYTLPDDVEEIFVQVLGSTGGIKADPGDGGGGGAGYSETHYSAPNSSYSFTIGAGGAIGYTTGGNSTFGAMTVTGAEGARNNVGGSTGGVGSGGGFNATGGIGGVGRITTTFSGGGGGGGAGRGGTGGTGGNGTSGAGGAGGGGGGGGNGSGSGTPGAAPTSVSASAVNEGLLNDSTALLTTSDACTGYPGLVSGNANGGRGGAGDVLAAENGPAITGNWRGAYGGWGGSGAQTGVDGEIIVYEVLK